MHAIRSMAAIQYFRERRPWESPLVTNPAWSQVETAIRRMDNFCFPIVLLSVRDFTNGAELFGDEEAFCVVGGDGRYALFQNAGPWQYEDPNGSSADARLWESDQGYFCQERNVLTNLPKVLRLVCAYYVLGSYEGLDTVE